MILLPKVAAELSRREFLVLAGASLGLAACDGMPRVEPTPEDEYRLSLNWLDSSAEGFKLLGRNLYLHDNYNVDPYEGGADYSLRKVDIETGDVIWETHPFFTYGGKMDLIGVIDNKLIASTSRGDRIIAFDNSTGDYLWGGDFVIEVPWSSRPGWLNTWNVIGSEKDKNLFVSGEAIHLSRGERLGGLPAIFRVDVETGESEQIEMIDLPEGIADESVWGGDVDALDNSEELNFELSDRMRRHIFMNAKHVYEKNHPFFRLQFENQAVKIDDRHFLIVSLYQQYIEGRNDSVGGRGYHNSDVLCFEILPSGDVSTQGE